MPMTREDWIRRYYTPIPANVHVVNVDHRNDDIAKLSAKVMDWHSFGQFLYHDVLAMLDASGKPFNGKPEWFNTAAERGWIPRPNKPFPKAQVGHALIIVNLHTQAEYANWSGRAKQISLGSYLAWLRRSVTTSDQHWSQAISRQPFTDPYTREGLVNNRHPVRVKR